MLPFTWAGGIPCEPNGYSPTSPLTWPPPVLEIALEARISNVSHDLRLIGAGLAASAGWVSITLTVVTRPTRICFVRVQFGFILLIVFHMLAIISVVPPWFQDYYAIVMPPG